MSELGICYPTEIREKLTVDNVTWQDVAKYLKDAHELSSELNFRSNDKKLARASYIATRNLGQVVDLMRRRLFKHTQSIETKTR